MNIDELPRQRVERDDLGSLRTRDRDCTVFEIIELKNLEQARDIAESIDVEVTQQWEYPEKFDFIRHLSDAEQNGILDAMDAMVSRSSESFRSSWIVEEWLERLTDQFVHVIDHVGEFVWVRSLPFLEYADLAQRHALPDDAAGMLDHVIGAVPRFVTSSAFADDPAIASELSADSPLFLSPRL